MGQQNRRSDPSWYWAWSWVGEGGWSWSSREIVLKLVGWAVLSGMREHFHWCSGEWGGISCVQSSLRPASAASKVKYGVMWSYFCLDPSSADLNMLEQSLAMVAKMKSDTEMVMAVRRRSSPVSCLMSVFPQFVNLSGGSWSYKEKTADQ